MRRRLSLLGKAALVMAQVHGKGLAYSDPLDLDTLRALRGSVGLELRMGLELFFTTTLNLRLGYARGFGPEGIDHVYFLIGPSP